ncbi:phage tail protein [Dactylosporangium sp. NPDC049742]|uniref:phage tail protein n=1 Tax=Dactylosporangium sp. NPDC049742 TaxID=3154737 RepID=UPI0034431826
MALADYDAALGHSFGLEIDGIVIKQISEVRGLKMEHDVIEVRQHTADGRYVVRKLPGRSHGGELTLVRPLTADNGFEKWLQAARFGRIGEARRGGAVIVYDQEGSPLKRYRISGAWPRSLEIGALRAGDPGVLTETLVVTYEQMEVE